jgi:hypothetical protein
MLPYLTRTTAMTQHPDEIPVDDNFVAGLIRAQTPQPPPALRNFLAEACLPWFEAMRGLGFDVQEVRIEGHASSDWAGVSPEVAYFNNLNLSQQQAAAVLRHCLENVGAGETGRWARERATAVGYSSSRPVLDASGQENPGRSRRVVFSASVTTDDILTGIDTAVSN